MANDVAFADNSKLARNKTPTPRITPRVKQAIELIVHQRKAWDEAAVEAGMTTRNMRLALERPHVMAYYKQQLKVFLDCRAARNIHRLCDIGDADNNMPAVNAIKLMMTGGDEQTTNKQTASPGVTIRIVNVTATPAQHEQTTIDAKADEC